MIWANNGKPIYIYIYGYGLNETKEQRVTHMMTIRYNLSRMGERPCFLDTVSKFGDSSVRSSTYLPVVNDGDLQLIYDTPVGSLCTLMYTKWFVHI